MPQGRQLQHNALSCAGVRGTGEVQPATSDWGNSVTAGTRQLASRMSISAAYCPSQRFVLAGYSQGAWVVGDALAGGDGTAATASALLGGKVAAVVLYGDARFQAGQSYDTGTFRAGVSGVIARPKGALTAYASRFRSYCYADDPICQNGASGSRRSARSNETAVHVSSALQRRGRRAGSPPYGRRDRLGAADHGGG